MNRTLPLLNLLALLAACHATVPVERNTRPSPHCRNRNDQR